MKKNIVLAVPMGDPAGIGPEIVLKAIAHGDLAGKATIVVIGDQALLEKTAQDCALTFAFDMVVTTDEECAACLESGPDSILYHHRLVDLKKFSYGSIDGMCGRAAYECIAQAVRLTQMGLTKAVVTPPLHKESLKAGGIASIGHTEILGELTDTVNPVTMFETLGLKIFFMTRHLSLRQACDAVTRERLLKTILACDRLAKNSAFDQTKPLVVAGLNPHCGEHGLFGDEEMMEIVPAIEDARSAGVDIVGPVGADSVFHQAKMGKYKAVVSLYHDQGHIAAKTLDFDRTISVTWGLPFLRTSVDHGTAFDIAGKGIASSISMTEALSVALRYLKAQGV